MGSKSELLLLVGRGWSLNGLGFGFSIGFRSMILQNQQTLCVVCFSHSQPGQLSLDMSQVDLEKSAAQAGWAWAGWQFSEVSCCRKQVG